MRSRAARPTRRTRQSPHCAPYAARRTRRRRPSRCRPRRRLEIKCGGKFPRNGGGVRVSAGAPDAAQGRHFTLSAPPISHTRHVRTRQDAWGAPRLASRRVESGALGCVAQCDVTRRGKASRERTHLLRRPSRTLAARGVSSGALGCPSTALAPPARARAAQTKSDSRRWKRCSPLHKAFRILDLQPRHRERRSGCPRSTRP